MPNQQIQFKQCLLTYAQCGDLDPHLIVNRLAELQAACIIGRESHADGGTHLHVYCQWETKYRSRNHTAFDVDGRHPNIQPVKWGSPEWVRDYAIKFGDIVAGDPILASECDTETAPNKSAQSKADWSLIVASATEEEFWANVELLAPRSMGCNHMSLMSFARWKYAPKPEPFVSNWSEEDFDLSFYPAIAAWRRDHLRANDPQVRGMSIIIWGDTRTGKTAWSRCLGRHAYYNCHWNQDEPLNGVEYAVFDDLATGWKGFDFLKPWIGQQWSFSCTDKYRAKKRIQWGKPSIVLTQHNPMESPDVDQNWLIGNAIIVHVTSDRPLIRQI